MNLLTVSVLLGPKAAEMSAAFVSTLTTTTDVDPATWLVNAGSLGVIILLVVTGQLRTKAEVNQLNAIITRQDAQMAQKDELIKAFQLQLTGQTIPALTRSAQVIERIPSSDSALLSELSRTGDDIRKLAQAIAEISVKE